MSKSKSSEKKVFALRDSVVMKLIKKHMKKFMATTARRFLARWHVKAHKHTLESNVSKKSRNVAIRMLVSKKESLRKHELRGLVARWSRRTFKSQGVTRKNNPQEGGGWGASAQL